MWTAIDHLPMAEPCGPVLTCYVDTIGSIEILEPGVVCRVTYVEVRKIGHERFRVPVLELIRPLASYIPGHLQALLLQARTEAEMRRALAIH